MYTDGACRGNPGRGGWGVLMRYNGHEKRLYGGDPQTTNNRMELKAVIEGLSSLKRAGCQVKVVSDSKYVLTGITEWMPQWKQRGWKTAAKKPVLNEDLWRELDRLAALYNVSWEWVKGHSGHVENEVADMLANRGIDELVSSDDTGQQAVDFQEKGL